MRPFLTSTAPTIGFGRVSPRPRDASSSARVMYPISSSENKKPPPAKCNTLRGRFPSQINSPIIRTYGSTDSDSPSAPDSHRIGAFGEAFAGLGISPITAGKDLHLAPKRNISFPLLYRIGRIFATRRRYFFGMDGDTRNAPPLRFRQKSAQKNSESEDSKFLKNVTPVPLPFPIFWTSGRCAYCFRAHAISPRASWPRRWTNRRR